MIAPNTLCPPDPAPDPVALLDLVDRALAGTAHAAEQVDKLGGSGHPRTLPFRGI